MESASVPNVWAARAAANAKEKVDAPNEGDPTKEDKSAEQGAEVDLQQPAASSTVAASDEGKDPGEYSTVQVRVKQECAGFIVGPQGRVVNEIAGQTFTHIQTPRRGEEPVFTISGPHQCVKAAAALVQVKEMEAQEREDKGSAQATKTRTCTVPASVVGFVMGAQRAVITDISRQTRTDIVCPVKGGLPHFTVTGLPLSVDAAIACIEAKVLQAGASSWQSTPTIAHETIRITVPVDRVGLVVGFQGSVISQIALQTGTTIISPVRGQEPVFEVSGPKHLVELAKATIEQRVQGGGKGGASGAPRSKAKTRHKRPYHALPSVVTWFSVARR